MDNLVQWGNLVYLVLTGGMDVMELMGYQEPWECRDHQDLLDILEWLESRETKESLHTTLPEIRDRREKKDSQGCLVHLEYQALMESLVSRETEDPKDCQVLMATQAPKGRREKRELRFMEKRVFGDPGGRKERRVPRKWFTLRALRAQWDPKETKG